MDFKKVRHKNAQSNLTGILMTMLVAIAIFSAGFFYMNEAAYNAGETLNVSYNQTYETMRLITEDMENQTTKIQDNFDSVTEPQNVFSQLLNGLQGAGRTITLMFSFVKLPSELFEAIFPVTGMLPGWLKIILAVALIVFVVILFVKIITGSQAM